MNDKAAWKGILLDWNAIGPMEDENRFLACLTPRQAAIIQSLLSPGFWRTRWLNLPPEIDLDAIMSAIDYALIPGCCDTVIACIVTAIQDGTLDGVLGDWLVNNGDGDPDNTPVADDDPALINDCDPDYLFGAVTALLDAIHDSVQTFLAHVEVASNILELVNGITDYVPIFSAIGAVNVITDLANTIQESFQENYEAAWDDILRDEMRCELFCIAYPQCGITFNQLRDYYVSKVGGAIHIDLEDALSFFNGLNPFSGDISVYGLHWLAVEVMAHGGSFGRVDARRVGLVMKAADNDADWSILCDDCTWYVSRLSGDGNASIVTLAGVSDGNIHATYHDDYYEAEPRITPPPPFPIGVVQMSSATTFNVRRIKAHLLLTDPAGRGQNITIAAEPPFYPTDPLLVAENPVSSGSYILDTGDINEDIKGFAIRFTADVGGTAILEKIEVWGSGDVPTWE